MNSCERYWYKRRSRCSSFINSRDVLIIPFHVDFFCSCDVFPEKMIYQNDLVYLTSERFLKFENTQKKGILFCRVKKQIRGDHLENPQKLRKISPGP
jgi:hypothetical protein